MEGAGDMWVIVAIVILSLGSKSHTEELTSQTRYDTEAECIAVMAPSLDALAADIRAQVAKDVTVEVGGKCVTTDVLVGPRDGR